VRRGEAVLIGTASLVFLAGCALVGLSLAETETTQDIWTNVWFDCGMPLLILAIAMAVHAVAKAHRRSLPPAVNGADGPNGEIRGALHMVGVTTTGTLVVGVDCLWP
jgi:glycerol uptake facilitator-like aquaporin